jgi:hypothetical protein
MQLKDAREGVLVSLKEFQKCEEGGYVAMPIQMRWIQQPRYVSDFGTVFEQEILR